MELRKDYFLSRWVVIAEDRGKRPHQFASQKTVKPDACVFCPGNEAQTPPELYRSEKDGKWQIRVVHNKFSAVDPKGDPKIQTHNQYYTFAGDHGEHEIVVETPNHNKNFGDLSIDEMREVMKTYALRLNALYKDADDKYVCLFRNQGREAGASIEHPHSQLISFAMMPPVVAEKLEAMKKFPSCPYCSIIQKEKDSLRRCFENDSFVAFTPYASRFNYEIWIMPKKHIKRFDDFDDALYNEFCSIMKMIVQKLEGIEVAYNIEWYYAPNGEDLHFHVEIAPRIALWAGFEVGFGIEINTISPEAAARFYRGEA